MGSAERYVVKPGDRVETIAARFRTTRQEIARINAGKILDHLGPGDILFVPVGGASVAPHGSAGKPFLRSIRAEPNTAGSEILTPAETHQDEFELRLQLVLYMKRMDPGPIPFVDIAGRQGVAIAPWPPGMFETFKTAAKTKAELFWSHRFQFWPPGSYPFFNWPPGPHGEARGVDCTLSIAFALDPRFATHVIRCFRRAAGETTAELDTANWTDAISEDRKLQGDDAYTDNNGIQVPTTNNTVAHEVGHLLGLDHPHCTGQERECYGDGHEAWKIMNIMGAGNNVLMMNAKPWLDRLVQHTGVSREDWTPYLSDSPYAPGPKVSLSYRGGRM